MFGGTRQLLNHQICTTSVARSVAIAVLVTVLVLSILYEMDPCGWRTNPTSPVPVMVHQGDTLWTLARTYGRPAADPRRTVSRIREANDLAGSLIRPGQVLLVPQG